MRSIHLLILTLLLSGCVTEYIPVETVRTEYRTHTDSIRQIDSIFNEKETVIREADRQTDSLLLAKYGIRLRENERMLLFLQKELEKEKGLKQEVKTDTVIKVDSVQVPYPVEKKIPAWERVKTGAVGMLTGMVVMLAGGAILWIRRKRMKS